MTYLNILIIDSNLKQHIAIAPINLSLYINRNYKSNKFLLLDIY